MPLVTMTATHKRPTDCRSRRRFIIGLSMCFVLCHLPLLTQSCYVFPADKADPCIDLKCPPGAKCLPSSDGKTATCQCPTR